MENSMTERKLLREILSNLEKLKKELLLSGSMGKYECHNIIVRLEEKYERKIK